MAVERYGSKTDVVVKLILVFFISLLSFTVGTFVGKKFSDNQHKISQLEPQESNKDRDVASLHADNGDAKPKDALNDEEIKKLAEEFVADDESKKPGHEGVGEKGDKAEQKKEEHEAVTPTHAKEGEATEKHETKVEAKAEHAVEHVVEHVVEHGTEGSAKMKPSEAANRVVAGQTPEVESEATAKEKTRIPQSLPKELASSAIGKFTVQLAAFPTEPEAQKLANDLKEKGFSAFYVTAKVKDKKTSTEKEWFRVSVGLFSTQKEAEAYKADLIARAKISSALIQKITN